MQMENLATIELTWDKLGNISNDLTNHIPANEYQREDALALCVPLVFCSQLGVLAPKYGLKLVLDALNFLRDDPYSIHPIEFPLSTARIDLNGNKDSIVCTFHPEISPRGSMEVEEGVRRLLNNFMWHIYGIVRSEMSGFMKDMVLVVILEYIEEVLNIAIQKSSFRMHTTNQKIQIKMIEFQYMIFPIWGGRMKKSKFNKQRAKAIKIFENINTNLNYKY